MAYLFDFEKYIEDLRGNEKEKNNIDSYESYYDKIGPDIRKQVWYSNYVRAFEDNYPQEGILVPDDLKEDFDWKVLFALITASFSSTYRFEKNKDNPKEPLRLWIKVTGKSNESEEETTIEKSLDELWSFQILRLFEIYVVEQINLQKSQAEDPESDSIYKERKRLLAVLKKSLKKVYDQDEEELIVFHYTSLKSFSEILQSKVLRATNVKFLQRRTEVNRWFDIFDKAADEVRKRLNQSNDDPNSLSFLEEIGKQVNKARDLETYIFSTSKCPDDEGLFDLYGDKGKGVCIGFKRVSLSDRAFEFNKDPEKENREVIEGLLHGYVEYDEDKLIDEVKQKIDVILEECKGSKKSPKEFFDSVTLSKRFVEKCIRIYMRCQDAKDASYSGEKEYCLYWQQKKDNLLKAMNVTIDDGRIIPYVNLELGKDKLPITEIIVGPQCDDAVVENIQEVMDVLGYKDFLVKRSAIPLVKKSSE